MSEYKLPDVGEGLTEAEIVTWKVKVGDVVKVNDIVVEIETAKSLVELPSPYAGTVQELLVPEGETVEVGTPIVRIGAADEAPAAQPAAPEPTPQTESDPYLGMAQAAGATEAEEPAEGDGEQPKTLVGYGPRAAQAKRRPRKGAASASSEAGAATQAQVQGAFAPGGAQSAEVEAADEPAVPAASHTAPAAPAAETRVLAKPPVRKLAKDLGVDLRTITPSGPDGTVTRDDVHSASPSHPDSSAIAPREPDAVPRTNRGETREPIKGVRKMMAQAMTDSAFTAPHVTEWVTVDVTGTMQLLERLKAHREFAEVSVSPLLVAAKACMLAMKRTPEVNAAWDADAQEVVFRHYVNLGIAAATPRGLVVPNVKDADTMSMAELGAAIKSLARTARDGKTQPAEMAGGTFTISNVGVFGVDSGTPIINPGESAILALGTVRKQPWVHPAGSDEIAVRSVTTLALSFDHRLIDGEKGSRFLADVAGIMEDPANALRF
ncbi:MAG TPA: dihydrolipoamide acetyltransferase family protein [Nocardioidaceae bacterium]|nr:dihydrolipoamide acetyltransferase family protein [Nocardioidaceae bacterium]